MDRIEKRALSLINKCKKLYEWVKQSTRNMVVSAVCLIVIIAVLVLIIRFFWYFVLAVTAIWVFWEDIIWFFQKLFGRFKRLTLEDDGVCFAVTKFMYDTICEDKPLEEITKTPSSTVRKLYDTSNYLDVYNEAPILKLRLVRKNRDIDIDCDYLKDILQISVDARITDGHLQGYTWAIPADKTVPLIKVATLN